MKGARPSNLILQLPEIQASIEQIPARFLRLRKDEGQRCFVFTGTEPEVGTTLVAAATAMDMALHLREPVTLIETDVESPRLAGYLGVSGVPGMSELLEGRVGLDTCCRAVPGAPSLQAIPAGSPRDAVPGEMAEKGRLILEQIKERAGFVLLDAAPVVDCPETRMLVDESDGVILVMRARHTRKDVAKKALELCELTGTPVIGVVLNRFKPERFFL